jgi:hypothetical protein
VICRAGTTLLAATITFVATSARADDPPPREAPPEYGEPLPAPPRSAPQEYTYEPLPPPPPLGHKGFQLAIRTGLALPIGLAKDRDPGDELVPGGSSRLVDLTTGQIPLIFDIGGKPNHFVFVGAYVAYAVGLAGGSLASSCNARHLDCYSSTFRVGAQVRYDIAPHDRINPWVGYGLGFAWLAAGDQGQETNYQGFDFGHFMAGVDFRLNSSIGVGPFVDYTVGKYWHRRVESAAAATVIDEDIEGRSFHYWVTFGPRFVFLP